MSKIAQQGGVSLQQFLQDNAAQLDDLSKPVVGKRLLVCPAGSSRPAGAKTGPYCHTSLAAFEKVSAAGSDAWQAVHRSGYAPEPMPQADCVASIKYTRAFASQACAWQHNMLPSFFPFNFSVCSHTSVICVAAVPAVVVTPDTSGGCGQGRLYVIKTGDTIWKLASEQGTTMEAILAVNPQIKNPDLIFAGQKMCLP